MYYNCYMTKATQQAYSDLSGSQLVDAITKDLSDIIGACDFRQIEDGIEHYLQS